MTCHPDERFEDYLLGRLADDEQEAFESHYFECESCFE